MPEHATYQAQYEILDQECKLSEIKIEARQRIVEDILKLGMILIGEATEPELIEIEGRQWIQLAGQVRDAGQLLDAAVPA